MQIHSAKNKPEKKSTDETAKNAVQLQDNRLSSVIQKKQAAALSQKNTIQQKTNDTGLPDNLKSGIENLSGHSMDDVKVHYNSSQPAQLNAHAFAQGNQIHVAPGQEKHLPHEAWHVVQQKQGRVRPTKQLKGKTNINDDEGLENEADVMGAKAVQLESTKKLPAFNHDRDAVQAKVINNAGYSGAIGKNTAAIKQGAGSIASSKLVQREAWLVEKSDKNGEYPVLLMEEGVLTFLEEFGHTLEGEAQKAALLRLLNDPIQRYYPENKQGAKDLYQDIVALSKPIATLSYNYRYDNNAGRGALKYDPVGGPTKGSVDVKAVDHIREARGSFVQPGFEFKVALEPEQSGGRKIMVVPSVGCPEFLTNINAVMHLQWAAHAKERPTYLFVPGLELDTYKSQLGSILEKIGVGLVGWTSSAGLLGFGASRLAAQHFAFSQGPRTEAVMCDVNAVASDDVTEGYDTGEEKGTDRSIKAVKGEGKYSAAGFGTGIPWYDYDSEEDELTSKGASKGGDTRPIEQVVIVGNKMLYDPSFITSSEDADLTDALLTQEQALRKGEKLDASTFKHDADIKKVAMDSKSLTDSAYMRQRAELLVKLAYEDHILIEYRKGDDSKEKSKKKKKKPEIIPRIVTIGQLASEIAEKHKLDQKEIRSLIVEKIILGAKQQQRSQNNSASGSKGGSNRNKGGSSLGSRFTSRANPLKDVLHQSVMSEAARIGADQTYHIGFADGTDHNCSIISIFKAAGVNITSEQAQSYRQELNIQHDEDIDVNQQQTARRILDLVTRKTGKKYRLYSVDQRVGENNLPTHGTTQIAENGGDNPIYIFFAGTHFSPAWPKQN